MLIAVKWFFRWERVIENYKRKHTVRKKKNLRWASYHTWEKFLEKLTDSKRFRLSLGGANCYHSLLLLRCLFKQRNHQTIVWRKHFFLSFYIFWKRSRRGRRGLSLQVTVHLPWRWRVGRLAGCSLNCIWLGPSSPQLSQALNMSKNLSKKV